MGLSSSEILAGLGGVTGVLDALASGADLDADEAAALLDAVFDGEVDAMQVAGILVALRAKGETAEELTGMVRSMVAHAKPVLLARPAMDIVGTGGDGMHSINVSTLAALVVAGAGVDVCKHGNRAASSAVGTADVLEELGVRIELEPEEVARSVEQAGIGFCFAQAFHPAMRYVAPVRRALGIRTAFNFLGPLSNPSRPSRLLVGTADPAMAEKMAAVLGSNGVERAWVVHADDGLDEISLSAPTAVVDLTGDGQGSFSIDRFTIDPAAEGFAAVAPSALTGGDAAHNAAIVRSVLAGEPSAAREIALLNAAAALVVAGRAAAIAEGAEIAAAAIDDGRAAAALDGLVASTSP